MAIDIRSAGPDDAPIIAAFNTALAEETEGRRPDAERLRAGVAALLADPLKGRYWLASENGKIAGQISITYEWSDWRNGMFWWIQSVYVHPEHRKTGVFSRLYRHVFELADNDPAVCGIRLYVDRDNKHAQAVYRSLGLDPAGYQVMEIDFRSPRKV